MAKINVSLDADLVIDLMLLSGVGNAQDAVELVVRDYLIRGRRTEAVAGSADEARGITEAEKRPQDG